MNRTAYILLTSITLLSSINLSLAQEKERTYEFIAEKSTITWLGRKADQKYSGEMKLKSGYIKLNNKEISQAAVFANVQSLNCKDCESQEIANNILEYAKSAEFLNVKNMDFASFKLYKSSEIENSKDGNYRLEGNLTIIGYSNVISLPVTILEKKNKIYIEGKMSLNRSLWHLNNPKDSEANNHIGQTIELFLNLEGEIK